ncbi:MAG: prepilin-type N-terminal cleavage/methylation domain-containing protein [Syntrophales bacterium]|jgi:prepilin-type N-terminal cleavage/methylation domain-containing protein|nr:prepilin-type N-terminal cleavage/methylation domain-containing protein [Syntrophales bacterium]MCK9528800.1 prepilin-type N-terminal cleavage/methylation domain-containing protein [Syntrophales bacterium]MDX9922747.1 CFI-box-CTERM domain-containing protein [Syntrophales bacterium]
MKNESGFTLIEIIVTLVLVGILAAVAGIGIVSGVKGYLFVRDNTEVAGKAQVALARMSRELIDLRDIPNAAANAQVSSIAFHKVWTSTAIGLDGQNILLASGGHTTTPSHRNGDVLIDQVESLSFQYMSGADVWNVGDNINELSHIIVNLTLSGAGEGSDFVFNTVVHPRNNGNIGGPAPPTPDDLPQISPGCFVATAAYGNSFDPRVIILKQFRDRYLMTWPGGRSAVRLYYDKSPSLAELINDKPSRQVIARIMLAPVVGLSFLLLYAKETMLCIILFIVIAAWLSRYAVKRRSFWNLDKERQLL